MIKYEIVQDPIYNRFIVMVYTDKMENVIKEFNFNEMDDDNRSLIESFNSADAVAIKSWLLRTRKHNGKDVRWGHDSYFLLINSNAVRLTAGIIAHESLHLLDYLVEDIVIKDESAEPRAYYIELVVNFAHEFLRKNKVKLKTIEQCKITIDKKYQKHIITLPLQ